MNMNVLKVVRLKKKPAKQFTTIYMHINTMFVTSMFVCSGLVVFVLDKCKMPL